MKNRFILFIALLQMTIYTNGQGSSFNITYSSFPASAETAFNYAASKWTYYLSSGVPIKVRAVWFTFPTGPLAITFSNGRKDFVGAPFDSTWYPTSLANSITGTELNVGEVDMDIFVNGAFSWYYGTDGLTPAGQYDFVSVIMHELGHGLGFTSLTKKDSTTGSIGFLQMSDFAPATTSFPWPDLDSLPGIYDRYLENNSGTDLISYPNPSSTLGSQLTSGAMYFNGANTLAETGGTRARVHAPASFALGTSVLHLNEATYPVGHAEELMTPYISTGNSHHYVGPMTLAMLKDIGWNIYVGLNESEKTKPSWTVWPNPADNSVQLLQLGEGNKSIEIQDLSGKLVLQQETISHQLLLDCSMLNNGMYLVVVKKENRITTQKLIVHH